MPAARIDMSRASMSLLFDLERHVTSLPPRLDAAGHAQRPAGQPPSRKRRRRSGACALPRLPR
jgi:hypothetical protein